MSKSPRCKASSPACRPERVDSDMLRADVAARQATLDDEFAFVATCNVGGEFMAPEKIDRLKELAGRRWLRTLDDRMGVSEQELLSKQGVPAQPLPVLEQLLADKPEHITPRAERDSIAPDNPWGFRITPPANLYNRGEIYNLSIARGTLTAEDRYKINEHIVQTIKMLSSLPFPKHLSRVTEIAGGHHEKLDGGGYPCSLDQGEHERRGEDHGHRGRVRGAHRGGSPLQEGQDALRGGQDHELHEEGQAHRSGPLCNLPGIRRLPRVRAPFHAARAD
jgi:hypothetical protein